MIGRPLTVGGSVSCVLGILWPRIAREKARTHTFWRPKAMPTGILPAL